MSDIEKIGLPDHESTTSREQIIDPDAGLSPEEKKAAVSLFSPPPRYTTTLPLVVPPQLR